MSRDAERIAYEKEALREARQKGGFATFKSYLRFSGPGWLQGAITLGGGSLAGSLYLGVLGGYNLLWLQWMAMIMGVIMLSAITYVTLSTGKRPLRAINEHVNPVLGWSWAIATLMANIVWCLPQFALGTAAVQQNLVPGLNTYAGKWVICLVLLGTATAVIWAYDTGLKGVRVFEWILKSMVALVVLCFFGVVIKMAIGPEGLPWASIAMGFVPDFSLLSQPAGTFNEFLAGTGASREFWSQEIVNMQRDVMITAAATAVGINMTFLLPYSMLRKGWDRESRGLAIFDLGTGLFIPFVLATSCVVIASAARFHTQPQPGVIVGEADPGMIGQYEGYLKKRLEYELGSEAFAALSGTALSERLASATEADKRMAAMLVKRDAFDLAASLENLTGRDFSHYFFGIGVLGMALSTIIILMLISGFTICEMFNLPHTGTPHRLGCMVAGIGFLGPFIWTGKTQVWLAVPTSVFGMALLPIAYLAFFLMMNNRDLMGSEILRGTKRTLTNVLLLISLAAATFGAAYAIWSKIQWLGVALVALLVAAAVVVHFIRPPKKASHEPSAGIVEEEEARK